MPTYAGQGKAGGVNYSGASPADFNKLKGEPSQPMVNHVSGPNKKLSVEGETVSHGRTGTKNDGFNPDNASNYNAGGYIKPGGAVSSDPTDIKHSV